MGAEGEVGGDGFWKWLSQTADAMGQWLLEHEGELRALSAWGTVTTACRRARLYAPLDRGAWDEIIDASRHTGTDGPDYNSIIISAYRPGTSGFDALEAELLDSPLLGDRRREVEEVIASLTDDRNYVAICGALPLVEYVISKAAGKWNHPDKHVAKLRRRMHREEMDGSSEALVELAATRMILDEIPNVWKSGPQRVGAIVDELNRQYVLHGSARGWDGPANATRASLLLAAVARVSDPLFKQRSLA